jgi:hypothetical protein
MASGSMASLKDMESSLGLMAVGMKASGSRESLSVKVLKRIRMAQLSVESGKAASLL